MRNIRTPISEEKKVKSFGNSNAVEGFPGTSIGTVTSPASQKSYFSTLHAHDRFRVDIYSAHVLISITFVVFEYLDTALATENKIFRFSRAVLPYIIRSSNVNLALILFFRGQTSYKRVT